MADDAIAIPPLSPLAPQPAHVPDALHGGLVIGPATLHFVWEA